MSVELFEKFLKENKLKIKPVRSEIATLTAEQSAKVHGVPTCNIIKSLLIKADSEFFICLCPGDKKIDFKDLKTRLDKREARMATPDEVKEVTGHSIGGVPPFGHKKPLKTVIIEGFDASQFLWAAAGAADVNLKITLPELKKIIDNLSLQRNGI